MNTSGLYLKAVFYGGHARSDCFRPDPHDALLSKRQWEEQAERWRASLRVLVQNGTSYGHWEQLALYRSRHWDQVAYVQLYDDGR